MKSKFDFSPFFCPNCGRTLNLSVPDDINKFYSGQGFTCDCGMRYAYEDSKEYEWIVPSQPPDDNRDVMMLMPNNAIEIGWYGKNSGLWHTYADAPQPVEIKGWKEIAK